MTAIWTVKNSAGQLRPDIACATRLEVGRRIVPQHFDAFRLEVSRSYRQLFDRAVDQVLAREGWEIVRARKDVLAAEPAY